MQGDGVLAGGASAPPVVPSLRELALQHAPRLVDIAIEHPEFLVAVALALVAHKRSDRARTLVKWVGDYVSHLGKVRSGGR